MKKIFSGLITLVSVLLLASCQNITYQVTSTDSEYSIYKYSADGRFETFTTDHTNHKQTTLNYKFCNSATITTQRYKNSNFDLYEVKAPYTSITTTVKDFNTGTETSTTSNETGLLTITFAKLDNGNIETESFSGIPNVEKKNVTVSFSEGTDDIRGDYIMLSSGNTNIDNIDFAYNSSDSALYGTVMHGYKIYFYKM